MKRVLRIGVFGGTFDPIHRGHLAIAEEVLKKIGLERILLIPSGRPPHKKSKGILASFHRLAMVRLAVQGHPGLEASDLEIARRGKSYTIETIKALAKIYPRGTQYYLILGLDAFLDFCSWREESYLRSRCHIIVVSRPGFRFLNLLRLPFLKSIDPESLKTLDRGRRSRYDHRLTFKTQLILFRVKVRHDLSATQIRTHVKAGNRLKNLLPPRVESYIINFNLYNGNHHLR